MINCGKNCVITKSSDFFIQPIRHLSPAEARSKRRDVQHQELRRDDDHDDGGGAGGGPELQAAAAAADESKAVVEGALLRLAYGTEGEGATLQVNFNKIHSVWCIRDVMI